VAAGKGGKRPSAILCFAAIIQRLKSRVVSVSASFPEQSETIQKRRVICFIGPEAAIDLSSLLERLASRPHNGYHFDFLFNRTTILFFVLSVFLSFVLVNSLRSL
jgi:hypothetical protein